MRCFKFLPPGIFYLCLCAILIGIVQTGKFPAQSSVIAESSISTISAGAGTFYAIGPENTLYAWGDRYPQSPRLETATPLLKDVLSIDAGWRGCLAIDQQGVLWSIGEYLLNQPDTQPVRVMEEVQKVAVGLNHFICLTTDGEVYGCGRNAAYQLTSAAEETIASPVLIMRGVKDIATSDSDGCCALMENGDLVYWGSFQSFSAPNPVRIGQGFDSLPGGIWAVRGQTLYTIEKAGNGAKLVTKKLLSNIRTVYRGVVRMTDGRFLAFLPESQTFQEVLLPQDITDAYFSGQMLIRRKDGKVEQVAEPDWNLRYQ